MTCSTSCPPTPNLPTSKSSYSPLAHPKSTASAPASSARQPTSPNPVPRTYWKTPSKASWAADAPSPLPRPPAREQATAGSRPPPEAGHRRKQATAGSRPPPEAGHRREQATAGSRPPPEAGHRRKQATRKGWPYYIRRLHKRHGLLVYSRATPCGWPAWRRRVACLALARLSVNAYGKQATAGSRPPARGGPTIYGGSTSGTASSSIVGPPLAGGLLPCGWPALLRVVCSLAGGLLPCGWPAPLPVACLASAGGLPGVGGWPASRSHGLPLPLMGLACGWSVCLHRFHRQQHQPDGHKSHPDELVCFRTLAQKSEADEQRDEAKAGTDGGGETGGRKLCRDAVNQQAGYLKQANACGQDETDRKQRGLDGSRVG